jgi:hypothetical protein
MDAIASGIKDIDALAKATRLLREEVKLIVNDLSFERLIIKEEKKRRFFGGKKLDFKDDKFCEKCNKSLKGRHYGK